jgi:hypothetical protein
MSKPFDDMPPEVREAAMDLLTGTSAEEEYQILMSSVELDMLNCPPEKVSEVQTGYLSALANLNKVAKDQAGFFMAMWIGVNPKGEVYGQFEIGGNAPSIMLSSGTIQTIIIEHLMKQAQCGCPNCLLKAKLRAMQHMQT